VHPSAVVEEGAHIDPSASIGAQCVIGRGARIGAGTVLKPASPSARTASSARAA
jgi:UDP-3-O-[3-hydroxymyristoyl] glucosamine N-acyltransferase